MAETNVELARRGYDSATTSSLRFSILRSSGTAGIRPRSACPGRIGLLVDVVGGGTLDRRSAA